MIVNRLKLFASLGFTLLAFFFTSIVYAGGGGVYATVLNSEDSHWNTVQVFFDPSLFTCKGMVVSFNFENPVDGDKISGSNGDNSSTITEDATYQTFNGKEYLRCSTYAKVYSPKLELNRHFKISFKGEGSDGSRTIAISFGSPSYGDKSISLLPWEISETAVAYPTCTSGNCDAGTIKEVKDPKIELRLLNQNTNGIRRSVVIKWGGFEGNPFTSKIYARSATQSTWTQLLEGQRGPSAQVNIPNEDYYIKVNGCMDKVGTCVDSNTIFIGKINTNTDKITPDNTPSPDSVGTVIADSSQELEQKIASLEAQLNESKKEQSVLAQRVSDLVNFIKRLFPFFK